MSGISKSQVSRLCEEIDVRVKAFLDRPIEDDWPYRWIDATYIKVRQNRIVSVASSWRRAPTPTVGAKFWACRSACLRRRRSGPTSCASSPAGPEGCQAGHPDAHQGIEAAVAKAMPGTWQRCRVQLAALRFAAPWGSCATLSALAGESARRVVTAFMSAAFAQDTADAAKSRWRKVADQVRPSLPKLARLLDEAETDVLVYMTFPPAYRAKLHSTNPLERLNGEIKRRTEVVGIFPNEAAMVRLFHPAGAER